LTILEVNKTNYFLDLLILFEKLLVVLVENRFRDVSALKGIANVLFGAAHPNLDPIASEIVRIFQFTECQHESHANLLVFDGVGDVLLERQRIDSSLIDCCASSNSNVLERQFRNCDIVSTSTTKERSSGPG